MAESDSSDKSPIASSLKIVLLVLLLIYVVKVYLRAPEYRYIEVCYLPHKLVQLVWVDIWGAFVTSDNASYLEHARDSQKFFFSCTNYTAKFNWLKSFAAPR